MNTNTVEKLDHMAQLYQVRDSLVEAAANQSNQAIPKKVAQRLAQIQENLNAQLAPLQTEINMLREQIEEEVKTAKQSVKGQFLHAVFANGRISWNNDALAGYAEAHPEILKFRKVGEPTVAIRQVKHES